nr:MAG TPA: hypothetical protein [Caudoviricetes sp.]
MLTPTTAAGNSWRGSEQKPTLIEYRNLCSQIMPEQFRKVWLFVYLTDLYIIYINRLPVHYCMLISFIPLHRFSKVRVD